LLLFAGAVLKIKILLPLPLSSRIAGIC
jgi:hypothetical protein